MIVNYDSSIVNRHGASLTDDARVIIYDHHIFIVQATGVAINFKPKFQIVSIQQNLKETFNGMPWLDEGQKHVQIHRYIFFVAPYP
jgi:hypothetical protein